MGKKDKKKKKHKGKAKKDKKDKKGKKRVKKDKKAKGGFGLAKNRGCTDIICLLIFISVVVGWVCTSLFAYTHGDPRKLYFPTNSSGKLCGEGENVAKPYSMYFDIVRCLSLSAPVAGCPTVQACVAECPTFSYFPSVELYYRRKSEAEVKETMSPYCRRSVADTLDDWGDLVKDQVCPPWIVTSTAVLDRCIPDLERVTSGGANGTAATEAGRETTTGRKTGATTASGTATATTAQTTESITEESNTTTEETTTTTETMAAATAATAAAAATAMTATTTTTTTATSTTTTKTTETETPLTTTLLPVPTANDTLGDQDFVDRLKKAVKTALDILGARDFFFKALADIKLTWQYILICLFLSLFLSLFWIWTLR